MSNLELVVGILLCICAYFWIARPLLRKAAKLKKFIDTWQARLNTSPGCVSPIVCLLGPDVVCQCALCRRERGESVTEASETMALGISARALIELQKVGGPIKGVEVAIQRNAQQGRTV